jgi:hypothetical protein
MADRNIAQKAAFNSPMSRPAGFNIQRHPTFLRLPAELIVQGSSAM